MKDYLFWVFKAVSPLVLFLLGVTHQDNFVLYSSYLFIILIIIAGFLSSVNIVAQEIIKEEFEKGTVLKNLIVPPWMEFLTGLILSGTLIYFHYYLFGMALLFSSYLSYNLYGRILPNLKKN